MTDEEMVGQLMVGYSSDLDTAKEDGSIRTRAGYLFESDAFGYKSTKR